MKLTVWIDGNPGRSYYKCTGVACESPIKCCNYFGWTDKDAPHGWQMNALVGARDKIRVLEVQIDRLKRELEKMEKK